MNNEEKKPGAANELLIDIVCLLASYGILFFLPEKEGLLLYVILGISAFLFCIGFFRMGFLFNEPSGTNKSGITRVIFTILPIVFTAIGLSGIYRDQGSIRSITIAILLIIESLLFAAIAASDAKSPEEMHKATLILRAAAIVLGGFGIVYAFLDQFSSGSVIGATIAVIEAICLWAMGSGNNPFNDENNEIKIVPGMKTSLDQLYQDFREEETQLGKPWIGKISTIREDCLIYGPEESGFCVYAYYNYGRFYVSGSESPLFPKPEEGESHKVNEIPGSDGTLLAKANLAEAYAEMFARYAETGKVQWMYDITGILRKKKEN